MWSKSYQFLYAKTNSQTCKSLFIKCYLYIYIYSFIAFNAKNKKIASEQLIDISCRIISIFTSYRTK